MWSTQCIMYHWKVETHIIFKKLTCSLLLKSTHLIFTWKFIIKRIFNYILSKKSWKHMWIKLLKLALSSNNGPYPKHRSHVSNFKKHNIYKRLAPKAHWLLLLWIHPCVGNNLAKKHIWLLIETHLKVFQDFLHFWH